MISAIQAKALTKAEVSHLTVESMMIEEIPDQAPLANKVLSDQKMNDVAGKVKGVGVILDAIVNIGEKIWTIADNGRPVFESKNISANAIPDGITNWQQLAGWQMPRSKSYRVSYVNLFGMTVVDFQYTVIFHYGGHFNHQGRYIQGATVDVANLFVAWGYSFKSTVEVPVVANLGTVSSPVAGIQMNIHWSVDTVVVHNESRAIYFINGLGELRSMN